MKMRTDYAVPFFSACVALICVGTVANISSALETCQADLDREKALRQQAEDIKHKLILDAADDWCSDSLDEVWDDLRSCEEKDEIVRTPPGCNECWDTWALDMEATCRNMTYDFESKAEDTVLFRAALHLWDEYADDRLASCRAQKFEAIEQMKICLGPAGRRAEVRTALEATFDYQQSKSF